MPTTAMRAAADDLSIGGLRFVCPWPDGETADCHSALCAAALGLLAAAAHGGEASAENSQPHHRSRARSAFWSGRNVPLFILAAADSVITVMAQRAGVGRPHGAGSLGSGAIRECRWFPTCATSEKLFWPSHLAPMYPHPGNSLPRLASGGQRWRLLLLISALVLRWRDRRYLLLAGSGFSGL